MTGHSTRRRLREILTRSSAGSTSVHPLPAAQAVCRPSVCATIIRHSAGTISAFVGVLLVFPPIAGALPQSIQQTVRHYLPANIGNQLIQLHQGPTPDAFSTWVGFAILCGYALAALLVGGMLLT